LHRFDRRANLPFSSRLIPQNQLTASFSYSSKLLGLQALSFDIHTKCPGVGYLSIPLSPVFATLTKKAGVWVNFCQFGNLLRSSFTLLHRSENISFRFCVLRTLGQDTRVYPLQRQTAAMLPCAILPVRIPESERRMTARVLDGLKIRDQIFLN